MNKRTDVDFSKHELKVIEYNGVLIHEFKIPNTNTHSITFINACGVMTVTGDFGNWVFSREFHPSAESKGVSGRYWDEKLQNASVQKSHIFDADQTAKEIMEFKDSFAEQNGREMNEEETDWIKSLEKNCCDEYEYTYLAYRENPNDIDYESVPFGTVRHIWLDIVYDAFDAICLYLKIQESFKQIK